MVDLKENFDKTIGSIKKKAEGLKDKAGDKAEELKDKIEDKVDELKEKGKVRHKS